MNHRTWLGCSITLITTLASSEASLAEWNIEFYDHASNRIGVMLEYGTTNQPAILTNSGFIIRYNTLDGSIANHYLMFESGNCSGNPVLIANTDQGFNDLSTGGQIYGISRTDQVVKVPWLPTLREVEAMSMLDGTDCLGLVPDPMVNYGLDVVPEAAANYGMVLMPNDKVGFVPKLTASPKQSGPLFCDGFESCPDT